MILHRIYYNGGDIWVREGDITKGSPMLFTKNSKPHFSIAERDLPNEGIRWSVVAQSTNLSLPNMPYVEAIIEKEHFVAVIAAHNYATNLPSAFDTRDCIIAEEGYFEGYKAASTNEHKRMVALLDWMEIKKEYSNEQIVLNFQSLQPKIKSIEVEMENIKDFMSEETFNRLFDMDRANQLWKKYKPYKNIKTYTRDGKIFLKVKKVNYE